MIRRISTKWVLSVLFAVGGLFVGFAWFVNVKVSERMAGDVVRFHLLSMAADLAERLDQEIDERQSDVAVAASVQTVGWLFGDADPKTGIFRATVESLLNELARHPGAFDYVVAVDPGGRTVVTNTTFSDGTEIPERLLEHLQRQDHSRAPWFRRALEHGTAVIDFHHLDLSALGLGRGRASGGWYVGWAQRIEAYPPGPEPLGVLFALMNWEHIGRILSTYGVRQLGREGAEHLVGEDIYRSSYAWLWGSDADTIIGHPRAELYGTKVSSLEGGRLRPMVEVARAKKWGMYPAYEFGGVPKRAAFRHCRSAEEGGFGWVVGVGVDDADIYAPVHQLSRWLLSTEAIILSVAILLSLFVAHRTTRPIRDLEEHTRRVAHGDLSARIEVRSRDELGELARSFNRMLSELEQNREQLVRAEKEAAWREMARQVAHEIKNPLTPIALSAGLLRRAHAEHSPDFDGILNRTIDMIQRQVENMREVVRDFYAFAGEHRDLRPVEVGRITADVLSLHQAWAGETGIRVAPFDPPEAWVMADPDELQRALVNLVSNAIEAMPRGGELAVRVDVDERHVRIELRDSGEGIPPEVLPRLFEPHFTTRTSGTGLGLAIVRRIVEDLGGTVSLENAPDGRGAVARMTLPRLAREGDEVG